MKAKRHKHQYSYLQLFNSITEYNMHKPAIPIRVMKKCAICGHEFHYKVGNEYLAKNRSKLSFGVLKSNVNMKDVTIQYK